ncbi:MAG: cobalamin biosynthesis protein CbiM [Chloroflexota bacterium]|nr:MAG: cobalamin biosynthesis protein CbiM [Chloroflexota bacterium]
MHIPDGMLSVAVSLISWVVSAAVLMLALRRTRGELGERQAPLMGVMAAFIFAAQMINFPVAGGTSGHLLGGALAAIMLGPWAGMLVMTSVIIVQGLLFQDGGLLVMGANILNMGLLTVAISYGLYRLVSGSRPGVRLPVAGFTAWLSVMAAALATALELWLSGTSPLRFVAPAMLAVHALIGLGEALITVAALSFILRTRPDLLDAKAAGSQGSRSWVIAGMLIALGVVVLSPLAAADPDGLERVAMDLGFFENQASAAFKVLPDYTIPGLGTSPLSTLLAGLAGALLVAGVAFFGLRLVRRSRQHPSSES